MTYSFNKAWPPLHDHGTPDQPHTISSNTQPYTPQEVADFLREGFWDGDARAFDVSPGDTLTVNIQSLAPNGQSMARQALETWSQYTGILFEEITRPTLNTVAETIDAGAATTTTYTLPTGRAFEGTLSSNTDRDSVAVRIDTTIRIELESDNRNDQALSDPYLRIYNQAGILVATNDDGQGMGLNSGLTFTGNGQTYYIEASSYQDASQGDYRLSIFASNQEQADITFADDDNGAYATSTVRGNTIENSFINVNSGWAGGQDRLDDYHYQTYLHEIGHALGLGHAGDYNETASYGTDNHYSNDSWQMSVMSYFTQAENTEVDASFGYVLTPMMADIIAVHALYGTPTVNAGNTTYGNNSTLSGVLSDPLTFNNPTTFTILDTNGIDTFDVSGIGIDQTISLQAGSYSDINGQIGNIGIAQGTIIENAIGGTGWDTITGNQAANHIEGRAGGDTIYGRDGNDILRGHAGRDILHGQNGDDILYGGEWADMLYGGNNADALYGGQSNDNLWGDNGHDTLYGHDGRDNLYGGSGNDILRGGRDNDGLFGGGNNDYLYGGAGRDVLKGWSGDDYLEGGAGADTLYGGTGDDTMLLGHGDTAWGGEGADTFQFVEQTTGIITIQDFEDQDTLDLSTVTVLDEQIDTQTTYLIDTNNDGIADLTIYVNDML